MIGKIVQNHSLGAVKSDALNLAKLATHLMFHFIALKINFVISVLCLMKSSMNGAPLMGERTFTGAHLFNGISAVDNNLYMC